MKGSFSCFTDIVIDELDWVSVHTGDRTLGARGFKKWRSVVAIEEISEQLTLW
jgi:hypothetical protein